MTHTRAQTDRQAWKSSTPRDAVPLSQDEVTELTRLLTLASIVKLLDVPRFVQVLSTSQALPPWTPLSPAIWRPRRMPWHAC
jgi:hypothetical protein